MEIYSVAIIDGEIWPEEVEYRHRSATNIIREELITNKDEIYYLIRSTNEKYTLEKTKNQLVNTLGTEMTWKNAFEKAKLQQTIKHIIDGDI